MHLWGSSSQGPLSNPLHLTWNKPSFVCKWGLASVCNASPSTWSPSNVLQQLIDSRKPWLKKKKTFFLNNYLLILMEKKVFSLLSLLQPSLPHCPLLHVDGRGTSCTICPLPHVACVQVSTMKNAHFILHKKEQNDKKNFEIHQIKKKSISYHVCDPFGYKRVLALPIIKWAFGG